MKPVFLIVCLFFSFNSYAMDSNDAKKCQIKMNKDLDAWLQPQIEDYLIGNASPVFAVARRLIEIRNNKIEKRLPTLNDCSELKNYYKVQDQQVFSIITSFEQIIKEFEEDSE